jgi:hypothetical protein
VLLSVYEIGMAVIFKRRLEFVIDPQQNSLEALLIRLYSRWGYNRYLQAKKCKKVWVLWGMKIQGIEYAHQYVTQRERRASAYFIKISRHPVQLIKQLRYKIPIELKEL